MKEKREIKNKFPNLLEETKQIKKFIQKKLKNCISYTLHVLYLNILFEGTHFYHNTDTICLSGIEITMYDFINTYFTIQQILNEILL